MKNWDLLAKYVSDECSENERAEIERWIQHHPENEAFLERVRKIWHFSERTADQFSPDLAAARQNIWNRIEQPGYHQKGRAANGDFTFTKSLPHPGTSLEKDTEPLYRQLRRLAAIIVAGLAFVILALLLEGPLFSTQPKMVQKTTAEGEKSLVALSDGTKVWLNENSSLQYPEQFSGQLREITMSGEAFFDVAENPDKPFTIRTGNLVTKVLGTSFNLEAIPTDNGSVSINVVSGRVLFYDQEREDQGVVLIKGEKATFDQQEQAIKKGKVANENYLAWHTGVLRFDNTSLEEVAASLSDFYGKTVTVSPQIKNCHYTATFERQTLEEVLEVMKISLDIRIVDNGKEVALEGSGC